MSEPTLTSAGPSCVRVEDVSVRRVRSLLRRISPYCEADQRDVVLGAAHRETGGSDAGLEIVNGWYRQRPDYPGIESLTEAWRSMAQRRDSGARLADLYELLEAYEFDRVEVCGDCEPDFELCAYELCPDDEPALCDIERPRNALDRYSLTGRREEVERSAVEQVHVLGRLALAGQLTAIYGPPATGKSTICNALVNESIDRGRVDPKKVFVLDFDTGANGLLQKLEFAERYGFNLLSDGYFEFDNRKFLQCLDELIQQEQAAGTIIVLDTLKKFVSIMRKDQSASFATRLRRFSKAGGTVIALAHVNKHRASDGKPIFAGTTDILEDFDCGYLMYEIATDAAEKTRTVVFENLKARGDVAKRASYRYSIREGITYRELVESVVSLDDTELESVQRIQEARADVALIEAVVACITEGVTAKMELVGAAAQRANSTKRAVLAVVDRYCGTDPGVHKWNYTVHERGAKKYKLLIDSTEGGGLPG